MMQNDMSTTKKKCRLVGELECIKKSSPGLRIFISRAKKLSAFPENRAMHGNSPETASRVPMNLDQIAIPDDGGAVE